MQSHDYRLPGAYFVTICAQGRARHFGDVIGGRVRLSPAGQVVQRAWTHLPESFDRISLDVFVVMPDHFHGILWLGDRDDICASMALRG